MTNIIDVGNNIISLDMKISSGSSITDGQNLTRNRVCAIQMPSAWTTADLTFQASNDGATYVDVYDIYGTEVVVSADKDRYIVIDPKIFANIKYIKLRSGTSGTPVTQSAERIIKLMTRVV